MPNFKGFSTIGKDKKFTLTDIELIKQDLLNAFNIREGEMPGRPDVGSRIWEYVFDPNDEIINRQIENEITRIVDNDPRVEVQTIDITQDHNVVIANIKVIVAPDSSTEQFYIFFDEESQKASIS